MRGMRILLGLDFSELQGYARVLNAWCPLFSILALAATRPLLCSTHSSEACRTYDPMLRLALYPSSFPSRLSTPPKEVSPQN